MNMQLTKFSPILKETVWGGDRIPKMKKMPGFGNRTIGESWEISGVEGNESVVAEGPYTGLRLSELIDVQKEKLLGTDNYRRFGNRFPLLIKFIDARKDLSIQVHPDDETARRQGMVNGKNEMWYVLDSEPYASLRCGLSRNLSPEDVERKVADGTICDSIALYKVKAGDCFYIPAGRVHSIGAGCMIAEIQQTSDTTYRLYDYNRRDSEGNLRQLHVNEAKECMDYSSGGDNRSLYRRERNIRVPLVECDSFRTYLYDVEGRITLDYSSLDSFVILMGIKGEGTVTDGDGNKHILHGFETVLVPAVTETLDVEGNIEFLETYV